MTVKALKLNLKALAALLLFCLPSAAGDFLPRDPFTGAVPEAAPAAAAPVASLAERIYYVAPWAVDVSVVPPAPAAGSFADLADLAELKRWQRERTPEQCAAAWLQEDAGYEAFFAAVSPFARPTPDKVADVFKRVRVDSGSVTWLLKEKHERPRPFLRDINLIPCLGREGGYAYPSGHTSVAWTFAHILAELVPAKAQTYRAYAAQAALNRVIGGVHHPTDIEAGRLLAESLFRALMKEKKFRADLELLRRSLHN